MRPMERLRRLVALVRPRDVSDADDRIAAIYRDTGDLIIRVEQNLQQRRRIEEQQGRVADSHRNGGHQQGRHRNGGAASPA